MKNPIAYVIGDYMVTVLVLRQWKYEAVLSKNGTSIVSARRHDQAGALIELLGKLERYADNLGEFMDMQAPIQEALQEIVKNYGRGSLI